MQSAFLVIYGSNLEGINDTPPESQKDGDDLHWRPPWILQRYMQAREATLLAGCGLASLSLIIPQSLHLQLLSGSSPVIDHYTRQLSTHHLIDRHHRYSLRHAVDSST